MSRTTDAVCGGGSNATPNGSLFFSSAPALRANLELVLFAVRQIGNEQLPHAGRGQQPHRVHAAVPPVEVADHADAIGVRRPHREMHAGRRSDAESDARRASRRCGCGCLRRRDADRSRSARGRSGTDRRLRATWPSWKREAQAVVGNLAGGQLQLRTASPSPLSRRIGVRLPVAVSRTAIDSAARMKRADDDGLAVIRTMRDRARRTDRVRAARSGCQRCCAVTSRSSRS